MKNTITLVYALFLIMACELVHAQTAPHFHERKCATMQVHERKMAEDPEYAKSYLDTQEKINRYMEEHKNDPPKTYQKVVHLYLEPYGVKEKTVSLSNGILQFFQLAFF